MTPELQQFQEATEGILIGFAEVVKGWQKESPQLYDEAQTALTQAAKALVAAELTNIVTSNPKNLSESLGDRAYDRLAFYTENRK